MRILRTIIPILLLCFFNACGLIGNHQHQIPNDMEYSKINNKRVREAIEAWQKGDAQLWNSYFIESPTLLDDGHPRDFKNFSRSAIWHERFITIDKVENDGLHVYGEFHSDTWGDFKTYFKFYPDKEGKFYQLEIGQALY